MIGRTMGPGGPFLLVFLAILSIEAAQGMLQQPFMTADYLRTYGPIAAFDSQPCMLYNPYSYCGNPENCGSVNASHFYCDCRDQWQKGKCIGAFTDPCLLSPCKNGLCVPEGQFSARYTCQCNPGYYGNLCQYGPVWRNQYHVGGVFPKFSRWFPVPDRSASDLSGLRDMCNSRGLMLIQNIGDGNLRYYYSQVSNLIGGGRGFVYLGYRGPVYVSIHQRDPIQYDFVNGFSDLIARQKKVGFAVIQICMEPPNLSGFLVLPQIVEYNKGNIACEILGLSSYRPLTTGLSQTAIDALRIMSETYYSNQDLYFGLASKAGAKNQYFFRYRYPKSSTLVASLPTNVDFNVNTVSMCYVGNPCASRPCGPNAYKCLNMRWGFKCLCKNGFTGHACAIDMAGHRTVCGQYTLYALANHPFFHDKVRSVNVVAAACKRHSSTLPSARMSECEAKFYRDVSAKMFNGHAFMHYVNTYQEMAYPDGRQTVYAFTDRLAFHPQSVICHGTQGKVQPTMTWKADWPRDEYLSFTYDPCKHGLKWLCKKTNATLFV